MPPRNRRLASVTATTIALLEEERLAKAREALDLRRQGLDWWEIADKMRLTPKDAREAVAYGISAAAELVSDGSKAEMLSLEIMRLDSLMQANWTAAVQGDVPRGKFVLDLIKERVRLLELDTAAAQSVQTTVVVGGNTTEYLQALKEISEHAEKERLTIQGELAEPGSA